MKKPIEAMDRMRHWISGGWWGTCADADGKAILAYLDSIPDNAIPVVWPDGVTKDAIKNIVADGSWIDCTNLLTKLAAIAPDPKPKPRMVQLWGSKNMDYPMAVPVGEIPNPAFGWHKVGNPVEVKE